MQPVREEVKGKDLPEKWRERAKVASDETVTLIIQPSQDEMTQRLLEIAEQATAEAKTNGLTEEKLSQLLNETG